MFEQIPLTASGQTGNNTHSAVRIDGYDAVAVVFTVEAVGATPTVTWKVQGALADSPGTNDWYDLFYITDVSDTGASAGKVATAVSTQIIFLSNPVARKYRKFRLVTSANTNVTYHADAWRLR